MLGCLKKIISRKGSPASNIDPLACQAASIESARNFFIGQLASLQDMDNSRIATVFSGTYDESYFPSCQSSSSTFSLVKMVCAECF